MSDTLFNCVRLVSDRICYQGQDRTMKICPTCGRDYVDDLRFCLEDGTPLPPPALVEKVTERKTEELDERTILRPPRTVVVAARPGSSSKFGIIAVAAVLTVGVLTVLGAGIGSYLYYSAIRKQTAQLDETRDERPANVNATRSNMPANGTSTTEPPTLNGSNSTFPANLKVVDLKNEPGNRPRSEIPNNIPKTISGGVLNGKAISLPKPPYPPAAKAVRAGGSVSVQVLVDEQGNVVSANAVSGHPLLRAAAASAARAAKFSPTVLSGQPVKVNGVLTYNFVPEAPAKYD